MYSAYNSIIKLIQLVLLLNTLSFPQTRDEDVNWPEPMFEHITMADGLPENSVLCIMQDKHGYLWFGTQVGLVRYDGYSMKSYQYDPNDSLSISWGFIQTIYEDESGTLWIGTSKGFNRFNRIEETFTRFRHKTDDFNSINSDSINIIFEDNSGNILVGTNKGLNLFNPQYESFKEIHFKNNVYSNSVSSIIKDKLTGNIYIGSKNKIFLYDTAKQILTDENKIDKLISNAGLINSLYQSSDGSIWILHSMGLSRLDLKNYTANLYQKIPSTVFNIRNYFHRLIEDDNGFLWLISGQGENGTLTIFDPRSGKFKNVEYQPGNPRSISSTKNIWTIYKDRSGVIWVGTYLRGLNKWDRNKYKFKRFVFEPSDSDNDEFNRVWSVIEDSKAIIWFGTCNGLNSFNRRSCELVNYKYDPNGTDNTVTFVHKDKSDIFWLGTEARGLVSFDPARKTFKVYSNIPNDIHSISHNTIRYIFPDGQDILWIGTRGGGLNKFDKKSGKFIRYIPDSNNPNSLSNERVEYIFRDSKEILWIGAQGVAGLNRFDQENNSFKSFSFPGGGPVVLTVFEDKKENFWVGTFNRGISLFDRDSETFTENFNLGNNLVRSVLEDNSGNLWIGTDYGLSKFYPETKIVKNYKTSENFVGDRFSANSAFKISTGEMLFGTYDGFIIFHPDSIKDNPIPPQIVISNVSFFNRPGEELKYNGLISEIKELNLAHNENDLRFDYVGLHYADPSKNKYMYMLEGYEQDWLDAGTQRNATYTNLSPGEYTFKVKAANNDGVWSPNEASLKIIISNPWWSTGWAYTFYLLLFAIGLYAVRRFELNRSRLKNIIKMREFENKKQQEVDEMKSRFIANLSHEFRTPLLLIKGPLQQMRNDNLDSRNFERCEMIYRNTENLQQLINQLLELSQLEAASIPVKAEKLNLINCLKGLVSSFESLSIEKNISLSFDSTEDLLTAWIDRDKLEKIINNLLSNALKFTDNGGSITINVYKIISDKKLFAEVKINDSGIGISNDRLEKIFDRFYQADNSSQRAYGGSGIGLALVKELVDLHRWNISVSSSEGKGTEFCLRIPLYDDYLDENQKVNFTKSENMIVENEIKATVRSNRPQLIKNQKISEFDEEITQDDKPCLLIVEDSKDVQSYLDDLLNAGYSVLTAMNGVEGLKIALEKIPDLIVSDVMMPEMDGFEFCRKIKTDERTSHIPLILLTAKAASKDKISGLETGADDYIMKPFEAIELRLRIRNLIEQRKKLREYFTKQGAFNLKDAKVASVDKKFLEKAISIINNHISDSGFSVDLFADEVGMSRSQLHRKLISLIGESPGDLIRRIRLTKASKLIDQSFGNISEIALEVGFNNPANFAQSFKKHFGVSPTEYKK